jgi:hypothetical protein
MVAGHRSGALSVWDVRAPREPMFVCSRSASAVLRLAVVSGVASTFIAASNDGAVSQWHMTAEEATLVAEYTGADCEPVRGLAVVQCDVPAEVAATDTAGAAAAGAAAAAGVSERTSLFTAGDDGVVRVYSVEA